MRVLVTGANGFVGEGLARVLAKEHAGISELILTDRTAVSQAPAGARVLSGELADPEFLRELLAASYDLVFHLASVPGAMAEREPELGFAANLMTPINLAKGVAERNRNARFVFASSIAVYGDLGEQTVDADTLPAPQISYGAHKLMLEQYLSDLSRRGDLDAISLRLPGIVARPPSQSGHGSAFMSEIINRILAGEDYDCPVPEDASCWWLSRKACVAALRHAGQVDLAGRTVFQLPVLHLATGDVAAAAERVSGLKSRVCWGDDAQLTRIFGRMPPLDAREAVHVGFAADANAVDLVRSACL